MSMAAPRTDAPAAPPPSLAMSRPGAPLSAPGPRYRTTRTYADRQEKAYYIAEKYGAILTGSVLDVGCDEAPLRKLVMQPFKYIGVDMREDADLKLNLDRDSLPFPDRSFDTVVCTDVLEHLERCHEIFDELCRVSRRHVLVSLPNPLRNLLVSLMDGSQGRIKYYGLPVEKPADRHRWFFGHDEAAEFLTARGRMRGFSVEQLDCEEGGCPSWRKGGTGEDVLASLNIRGGTLWCALRRDGE